MRKQVNIFLFLAAGSWLLGASSCNTPAPVTDRLGKDEFRLADTIGSSQGALHIIRIDSQEYTHAEDNSIRIVVNANEAEILRKDAALVSHRHGVYTVRLINGDSVVLKEDSSEVHVEEFTNYTYLGSLGDLAFLVFERGIYGGADYLLVSLKDGSQAVLWGEPLLSPGNKHVFCSQYDLDTRVLPNGMQLFTPDSVKMRLAWKKEPELWGPVNAKWSGDTVIYFMQEAPDRHIGKELFFYAKVRMK
jgi:hypothetical protein